MADESDVEQTLVGLIAGLLYPAGTTGLGANAVSAAGAPAKVHRGMPLSQKYEQDLKAGIITIAVGARNGVERDATRYLRDWHVIVPAVRSLTVTAPGHSLALGGTVSTPQNIAVAWGNVVQAVYAVQAGDTLSSIAAALAAGLASQGAPVTASGAILTASAGPKLRGSVGGIATMAQETRRQDKSFQVSIFAPSPELRDATAKLIDGPFSDMNFIALPDLSSGLLRYERTIIIDTSEKDGEWRRDLFYWVEYPTIKTKPAAEVVSFGIVANTTGAGAPAPSFIRNL